MSASTGGSPSLTASAPLVASVASGAREGLASFERARGTIHHTAAAQLPQHDDGAEEVATQQDAARQAPERLPPPAAGSQQAETDPQEEEDVSWCHAGQ